MDLKLWGQEEWIFQFLLGHYPWEGLLFFIRFLALAGGGNFMGLHLVLPTVIALGWTDDAFFLPTDKYVHSDYIFEN